MKKTLVCLLLLLLTVGCDDSIESEQAREPIPSDLPIIELPSITNTIGMTFKGIPAGTFMMGSPESEKYHSGNQFQHKVTITKAFYMQTTEVTQEQWMAVMDTQPWKDVAHYTDGPNYAANFVNWYDANTFCKKLSAKEGTIYRLPTEAEWEYSCRAGTQTTWSFGNDVRDLWHYAWYASHKTHEGEMKKPNPFGLYDMHGNVYEWCSDYYADDYYKHSPENNPTGPVSGVKRVLRSGSWWGGRRSIGDTRSAFRMGFDPKDPGSFGTVGFRVVRELN